MKRTLAAALVALAGAPLAATAGDVMVTVDRPGRYPLPEGVSRVFVVNPGVADVEVIAADQMLVFGRMPGEAEIVLYGPNGQPLDTVRVRVANERRGVVTLYNGAERYSFRCVDRCEQVPMIGDGGLATMAGLLGNVNMRAAFDQTEGSLEEAIVDVPAPRAAPSSASSPASSTVPQTVSGPQAVPTTVASVNPGS